MKDSTKTTNNKILKLQETLGELYTPEEVAEYLKVSLSTVYDWTNKKNIDCYILSQGKRKSKVRFDIHQIQQFIKSRGPV